MIGVMGSGERHVTFTFTTSHQALWAEEVAKEEELEAELVPAPAGAVSPCGLALRLPSGQAGAMEAACRREGIDYARGEEG